MRSIVVVSLLGLLSACNHTSPAVSMDAPAKKYRAKDYASVLKRWTRQKRIIKELDTPLKVHATLFSPDFRQAYIARYAKMFALPKDKRLALAEKFEKEWRDSYAVILVAATHDTSWNDFDRKNSIWRVILLDDQGRQVQAKTVVRARRNTATLKTLFPQLDDFYQFYRLTFPKSAADGQPLLRGDAKSVSLKIAGPLGIAKLVWRLK